MVKARKVVRDLLKRHEKRNSLIEGLRQVANNVYPKWLRLFWLLIFFTSLLLCGYQTCQRAYYYLSEPIAVDVRIGKVSKFPSFTLCSQDTEEMTAFRIKHSLTEGFFTQFTCMNQLVQVIDKVENISVDDLWQMTNTTNILTLAQLKRLDRADTVTPTNFNSPMGICSVFHLNKQITNPTTTTFVTELAKPLGSCDTSVISVSRKNYITFYLFKSSESDQIFTGTAACKGSIHEPGQESMDTRNVFGFIQRQFYQVNLVYKQYVFLNSKKRECSDHKEYDSCAYKCMLGNYRRKKFPCRFPFMPRELNLPFCILKRGITKHLYVQAFKMFLQNNPSECNCLRRCKKIVFELSLSTSGVNQNSTTFNIRIPHEHFISVEERYAYEFAALMGDFGGNLGLYFGISIFTLVHYVTKIIDYFIAAQNVKRLENSFPKATSFVNKIFTRRMEKVKIKTRKKIWKKNLHTLIYITLLFIGSYLLFVRISYFLSQPIRVVMDVFENSSITFPSITLCAESRAYRIARKDAFKPIAKKRNITMEGYWKNFCELDFWSFFDTNKSASEIWAFTDSNDTLKSDMSMYAEELIGLSTVSEKYRTLLNTPSGQCIHYEIGNHRYIGTGTIFGFILQQKMCNENATLYVTAPNQTPNFYSEMTVPLGGAGGMYLSVKEVTYIHTHKNPCTTHDISTDCQRKCIEDSLNENLQCRLPYMENVHLPMCESSQSARKAHSKYTELFLKQNCNCTKSCKITIYDGNWYFEPRPKQMMTLFGTLFIHNTIDYIKEIPSYSLVQLICDIGAILGLTLGLCLPTIFQTIQNVIMGFAVE